MCAEKRQGTYAKVPAKGTQSPAGGDFCSCHAKQIDYIRNNTHAIPNGVRPAAGQNGAISNFFQFESNTVMFIPASLLTLATSLGEIVVGDFVFPIPGKTILFSAEGLPIVGTWSSVIGALIGIITAAVMIWARSKRQKHPGDGTTASITSSTAGKVTNFFIGRDTELAEIKSRIADGGKMVLVSGLGGIGKTEICRALYAQCCQGKVPGVQYVGWINYDGDLRSSFCNQFPAVPVGNGNLDEYDSNIKSYLNQFGRELLLFIDNFTVGDTSEIEYLDSLLCRVIMTSRQEIDGMKPITIDVLSEEQCRKLYRTHSEDSNSPNNVLKEIIKRADYHTLAVELLAKTQRASGKTAREFLYELKKSGFALEEIGEVVNHAFRERRFIEHFAMVFDIAGFGRSNKDREELRVLRLMSLLAWQPVAKTELVDWFAIPNPDAINQLVKKGWLIETTGTERPSVAMHPIIAEVVRYKKPPDLEITEPLVTALATKLRMDVTDVFTSKLPFLPHAISVAIFFKDVTDSAALAELFHRMAQVYYQQGDYAQDLEWNEKARIIKENVLGKEHPDTAVMYDNMGKVYRNQGDYDKALVWYEKALAIKDKVLGREHPDTAVTYDNMAGIYDAQGDYKNALEWYGKALVIKEKVLGKEHPSTAMTYNNIAVVYDAQGEYDQALEWHEKALTIVEKILGKEHPYTAVTYDNMAGVYRALGEYEKALEWYEKALMIREKVLGKEHPDTAVTYNNMAGVYKVQGENDKALEWYEKALMIREKVLPPEHPDTATTYNNIGEVHGNLGDYAKSQEWLQKALAIVEKILGKEHPNTAVSYNNMALVYCNQGDYDKALEWYEKALMIREKVLGKEHPDTAVTYNNIAGVYYAQGDFTRALEWIVKTLRIDLKVLGRNHPHFLRRRDNAEITYAKSGRAEPFDVWLEKTLAGE